MRIMSTVTLIHATRYQQGQNTSVVFVESHGATRVRLTMNIDISYRGQSKIKSEVWTPGGWTEVVHVFPFDRVIDSIYVAIKHGDASPAQKRAKGISMSVEAAFNSLAGLLRGATMVVVDGD